MNRKGETKRDNNPFAHSSYPRFNGGPIDNPSCFWRLLQFSIQQSHPTASQSSCNQSSSCSVAMTPLGRVFVPSDWKRTYSGRGANGYACWAHVERIESNEFGEPRARLCDMCRDYHVECRVYTPDLGFTGTRCKLCMRRSVGCVDSVCFQFSPLRSNNIRTKRNPLILPRLQTMSL